MDLSEYAQTMVANSICAWEAGDFDTARRYLDHVYAEGSDTDREILDIATRDLFPVPAEAEWRNAA